MTFDPTMERYVKRNGEPDYILLPRTNHSQFFYLEDDRVVDFKHPFANPASRISTWRGIPDHIVAQFAPADQRRRLRSLAYQQAI